MFVVRLSVFSSENTWEPSEILDCQDMIDEFEDGKKKMETEKKGKPQNGVEDIAATERKKKVADASKPPVSIHVVRSEIL